jgi:hypothetical protein
VALIAAWAATLSFALFALPPLPLLALRLGSRFRACACAAALSATLTWLHVGLFISAHDAMHATLAPRHRRVNDGLGALCVCAYAQFAYAPLARAHGAHHRAPGGAADPDFHDGVRSAAHAWLFTFMRRYVRKTQIARIAGVATALRFGARVPVTHLALFWALPSMLRRATLARALCALCAEKWEGPEASRVRV